MKSVETRLSIFQVLTSNLFKSFSNKLRFTKSKEKVLQWLHLDLTKQIIIQEMTFVRGMKFCRVDVKRQSIEAKICSNKKACAQLMKSVETRLSIFQVRTSNLFKRFSDKR